MNPRRYPKDLRFRWYRSVEKYGKSVKESCLLFGISRKTYYHWYAVDHGKTASEHHPDKVQPNLKLTHDVCVLVRQEKERTNYGPLKMKLLLARRLHLTVSTTILYRFYKKKGLIRRPQKRLPWYEPLQEPVIPEKPGFVLQIDTKHLWEDRRQRWQYTFIDIFTGLQQAVTMDTLDGQTTVQAFRTVQPLFPFVILGVQTDNGKEFRGAFHEHLGREGIAHYFIPKHSPQWNGAVERAHGVIDQEFYHNPLRPWQTLGAYLHFYNHERIHLGKYLNGLTPMEKLLQYQAHQAKVLPLPVN